MSTPVPAPRTSLLNEKKPIPTPRRTIPIRESKEPEQPEIKKESPKQQMEINTNPFTRKVKTISSAGKQIAEDIGGRVQEGKKAVIESTRQSVRRLTKRFHTQQIEEKEETTSRKEEIHPEDTIDLFSSIKFESPINTLDSKLYPNVHRYLGHSQDSLDLPPPSYPPPPLREESVYDEPQSLASGSTNSSENLPGFARQYDYESVFPSYPYNSDTDSCVDISSGTINRKVDLSRSSSWNFYDPLPKTENVYNNVDNTPTLTATNNDDTVDVNSNVSEEFPPSILRTNSLYENHEIPVQPPRPTQSVILQFDPLTKHENAGNTISTFEDIKMLEDMLQGDLYNNITDHGTFDTWSISNESEIEEYMNPPTPPTRYDSLPDDLPNIQNKEIREEKSRSQFYTNLNTTTAAPSKPEVDVKKVSWFKKTQEVLKKAPEIVRSARNKENFLQRPALVPKNNIPQKGMLYKITTVENLFGEYGARWCVLEGNNLVCYYDNTCENTKEIFPMDTILSVQIILDHKFKYK